MRRSGIVEDKQICNNLVLLEGAQVCSDIALLKVKKFVMTLLMVKKFTKT